MKERYNQGVDQLHFNGVTSVHDFITQSLALYKLHEVVYAGDSGEKKLMISKIGSKLPRWLLDKVISRMRDLYDLKCIGQPETDGDSESDWQLLLPFHDSAGHHSF